MTHAGELGTKGRCSEICELNENRRLNATVLSDMSGVVNIIDEGN